MEVEHYENQSLPRDRRWDALGELRVLPDEIICAILVYLAPRDVARLSCASSVMYILCNEEPLWMNLCLNNVNGPLQYEGSWKKATLHQLGLSKECNEPCRRHLHFDGFNSLFLYKRMYRCYTTLNGFSFDNGNVERKKDLSLEEFDHEYDGKKPVLLSGLADSWPASHKWTTEQLLLEYGDKEFRISQRSSKKVTIKFRDYLSYMKLQHDEDPLYIFDDKFGEVAPGLLRDYDVPYLFKEDFFDVLDRDQRPPFRWLIIGPERSGASWHVDPALTSAWNTLLCGRKRWALYPPGRVPLGVTVHVNEDDGDVNVETPSSLQWWLDFYPLLAEHDKPIECTQLPGETIYVPSGWWHCVLNLETTIAVTQNFVNSNNFEYVCLDMAPGYVHKGVCRAGLLALDESSLEDAQKTLCDENDVSTISNLCNDGFSYDINFLSMFLDKERDHYNSLWSSGNCIGERDLRGWLWKLWVGKPGLRDLIWKGACLALNADKWSECLGEICSLHELPSPKDEERLPVGTGSNPVYLIDDYVIKIYVEEGLEASLHGLGTELEFYSLLCKVNSPLKNHIPDVMASGILFLDNGSFKIVPWDGKGVPDVIANCNLNFEICKDVDFPFGVRSKKQVEYRKAGMPLYESVSSSGGSSIWPYIVTKRCKGKLFAELRDTLSWDNILSLASFLGEQLRNLHLLPFPSFSDSTFCINYKENVSPGGNGIMADAKKVNIPVELEIFIRTLIKKKKGVCSRLTNWGDPIPKFLIERVEEYIPSDFDECLKMFEDGNALLEVFKPCTWVHSDIMDDNFLMELCVSACSTGSTLDAGVMENGDVNGSNVIAGKDTWRPCHILDFSDLSIEDPILDVIPIHLDVFRGDPRLLQKFLESYKLPLMSRPTQNGLLEGGNKFRRLSYKAMCYCILHDDNILGAIFSLWKELRAAKSWEEVEETVWGDLNKYAGFR